MNHQKPPRTLVQKLKLVAVIGIPLGLVAFVVGRMLPLISVLKEADHLEARLTRAKTLGLIIDPTALNPSGIKDSDNAYLVLKEQFQIVEGWEAPDFPELASNDQSELRTELADAIKKAKLVADKPLYDAKRNYDKGYAMLFPDLEGLRFVNKVLCYDAVHSARKGNANDALASLTLARNVLNLVRQDPNMVAALCSTACATQLFRSASLSAFELRKQQDACKQIEELVLSVDPVAKIDRVISSELCASLALARNYPGLKESIALVGQMETRQTPAITNGVPKGELVRSGLPGSKIASGLLSSFANFHLNVYELHTAEPLGLSLLNQVKALDAGIETDLKSGWTRVVGPGWPMLVSAQLKSLLRRDMAKWSAEICGLYGPHLPASLPPRKESVYGGKLSYAKTSDGFVVYSWGEDGTDGGPPTLKPGAKADFNGDDFGMQFPPPKGS